RDRAHTPNPPTTTRGARSTAAGTAAPRRATSRLTSNAAPRWTASAAPACEVHIIAARTPPSGGVPTDRPPTRSTRRPQGTAHAGRTRGRGSHACHDEREPRAELRVVSRQ